MKRSGSRWVVLALIAALGWADRNALANVPPRENTPTGLLSILAYVLAPAPAGPGMGNLQLAGVEPDTVKARIVEAWFNRLRADPVIAFAMPGGAAGLEARLRDDAARDRLIRSGIARLTPQERLAYFTLLAKYIGQAASGDCHGVASVQDIADRISPGSMSDADAAQYFSLLHLIVIRSLLGAPLSLPTPMQYEAALRHLDEAVNGQLAGDAQAVARLKRVTGGAPGATMADICWASALLMRSTAAMDGPDRDALLLYMLGDGAPVQTPSPNAAHAP